MTRRYNTWHDRPSNECDFLSEPSYQTSDPELIPNTWMQTRKTASFFASLSGYIMVYGKVVKMEKRISINNFIWT